MKKTAILTLALTFGFSTVWACTNFLAGKSATTDGSTLITYAADSYMLYGALYHYPATNHSADAMRQVNEWDTGKYLGEIPEIPHTFSVIGNMNEHQLTIGETTFSGRPELQDTTGIIDYGSLIYITLQRAKTARAAIDTIVSLTERYGYYSTGESFSIGDPNEVWIMELIGKGVGNKGIAWVAKRIPDDCVSAHANQARITTIDFEDAENCLYADDVISFAREKGYYKGKDKNFSFSDTYAPLDFGGLRACEARVWSFFRRLDPEMDKYLSYVKGETKERMPLWIKANKKVSVQDFKNLMRDQYEGTELDMTKGTAAGPFGSKLRHSPLTFDIDGKTYWHERPTATQQTGFSFVAQMRNYVPAHVGGIFWFGVDDAATNLYVPMYARMNQVPECFSLQNGSLLEYSSTSAFWTYNWVANYAYSKYSYMYADIQKVQAEWEKYFNVLVETIDEQSARLNSGEAVDFLTKFSSSQAEASTEAWKKLGEYLLVKYMDGNIKKEVNGQFEQNEFHIPSTIIRPGYPEEFLNKIAPETAVDNLKKASKN